MDGSAIQTRAMRIAGQLPGVDHEHPFGPDWEVFKVGGRVFLLVTDVRDTPIVVLKSDPEDSLALRQQHTSITPGYHMNKRHWITLHGAAEISGRLVDDLVRESYLLVREGLPQSRRPALDDDLSGRAQTNVSS